MDKADYIQIAKLFLLQNTINDRHKDIIIEYCKEHNKSEEDINKMLPHLFSNQFFLIPVLQTVLDYYSRKHQITELYYNNKLINIY